MDIKQQLIEAYNKDAIRRDDAEGKRDTWKEEVRQGFVDLLRKENKRSVLELGAGAGYDSKHFQQDGFCVLATDLSPEMVKMCEKRGVPARVADIYDLSFLKTKFDAVYSMNVLLHVPRSDLNTVLSSIADVLNTQGLFFFGVYGGHDKEEIFTDISTMGLSRFFSFMSDASIQECVKEYFDVLDFRTVDLRNARPNFHFQALTLKKT